jgi:hypothetical protein
MNSEDRSITSLTPEEEKKFIESIWKHQIALLSIQITDFTGILAELKLAKECPITLKNLKRRYGSDYACLWNSTNFSYHDMRIREVSTALEDFKRRHSKLSEDLACLQSK